MSLAFFFTTSFRYRYFFLTFSLLNRHSRQAEELFHNSRLLLHVSLWTEDKESRIDSNSKIPYRLPIIIGTRAVTPSLLADESGDQGLYFVFQDLSIRVEGVFCLQFSLVDLQR